MNNVLVDDRRIKARARAAHIWCSARLKAGAVAGVTITHGAKGWAHPDVSRDRVLSLRSRQGRERSRRLRHGGAMLALMHVQQGLLKEPQYANFPALLRAALG